MTLFEKLNKEIYLKNYWEQKPLVVEKLLDHPEELITISDLTDMSENEYFETRVVLENNNVMSVTHGPLDLEEIKKNNNYWTLINHNVNLYSTELMKLQKQLEFVPAWLFDDAMTTYSNDGSSVGAHIDNYNVFIIQLLGKRQWQLQYKPDPTYKEGLDIKILKEFHPDETHILSPGDMIYIPPHVAHEGKSIGDSLSLSLGFKSLEDKALMEQLAIDLVNEFQSDDFYKTKFNQKVDDPFVLEDDLLSEIKQRVIHKLDEYSLIENAILKFTSSSKRNTTSCDLDKDEFLSLLKKQPLFKDEFMRLSAIKKDKTYECAINEKIYSLTPTQYSYAKKLYALTCEEEIFKQDLNELNDLLYDLTLQGVLFFDS